MNDEPAEAVITSMTGTATFLNELGLPFIREVVGTLGSAGVPELDDQHDFARPPWWNERSVREPTAFLDPVGLAVGIVLFSHTPVAEWAIGRVCDLVWDKAAKPALTRLLGRRDEGGGGERSIRVRVGTWFDGDKCFVEVIADLDPGVDIESVDPLVHDAFRLAATRIAAGDAPPPVLTVVIKNGAVVAEPIESHAPLD